MHRLGHWALCAGLPVIFVLYAPFGPLALVMLFLPLYLHYLYLFSHFLLLLPFLQGRCAWEIVLQAFAELGYPKHLFGLHSLRAGAASAAANAGVSDRLFKRHGRWRTDQAKDGYIKASLESLLSVSKVCMLSFSLFSFFIFEAGINKRDARPWCCVCVH